MEGDLARRLEAAIHSIAHIQIADNSRPNAPGSGQISYAFLLPLIDRVGYRGWVGCEYRSLATAEAGSAEWSLSDRGGMGDVSRCRRPSAEL
jgi:hydroxypyruvate isomerase